MLHWYNTLLLEIFYILSNYFLVAAVLFQNIIGLFYIWNWYDFYV